MEPFNSEYMARHYAYRVSITSYSNVLYFVIFHILLYPAYSTLVPYLSFIYYYLFLYSI